MTATYSIARNSIELQRLSTFSLLAFALATLAFFVRTSQVGYDYRLTLLALASAAIACVLLRVLRRDEAEMAVAPPKAVSRPKVVPKSLHLPRTSVHLRHAATRPVVAPATPEARSTIEESEGFVGVTRLIIALDSLLRTIESPTNSVGLMLVTVESEDPAGEAPVEEAMAIAQDLLPTNARYSRILRVDENAFVVTQFGPGVDKRLGRLSWRLHSKARGLGARRYVLRIGISVAGNAAATAADLLSGARQAARRAAALDRDTLFHQAIRAD